MTASTRWNASFIDKLGFSATAFGWLNSSYSVAAVLTLLIGGIVVDRIGTKKAIYILCRALPARSCAYRRARAIPA